MKPVRGWTLAEVLVGVIVVIILITFIVSASARAGRHSRLVECVDHLKQLHTGQLAYFASGSGDTSLRGDDLWLALTDTTPPLITEDVMTCRVSDRKKVYACDYFGPSSDPTAMKPDDYLGCDDSTNHDVRGREGGNILRKSGAVTNAHREIWFEMFRPGKGCVR